MRGHITWHELITSDPKAAIPFYSKVVGWGTSAYPGVPGYTLWTMKGSPAPMGGLMSLPEAPPNWLTYVATPDCDGTVRQATALGGRTVKAAQTIAGVGRFAVLADPQGAVFAVLQPEPAAPDVENPTQLGDFSWHELATTDWQAAWGFYAQLFGWQKMDAMDMGPQGTYQMFGRKGKMLGGFYNKPPEMPAPNWLPYALVKSADAAAATAAKLGAKIVTGPMDVGGGDRIAVFTDPQGAAFAVHSRKVAVAAKKMVKPVKKVMKKKAAKKKVAKKKVAKKKKKKRGSRRRR